MYLRRSFIIYLLVSLLIIISCNRSEKTNKSKPNILFILADDLGYRDLSCMGSSYYETPQIDRIATEGVVFTNGYAACQVCSPSRASILTGKFPARHGITDWIGAKTGEDWRQAKRFSKLLPPDYIYALPRNDSTLAEMFRAHGYNTFFAGKWHLGMEGSYPEDHGFNINIGGYEVGGPYSGGYFSPFNNPKMQDYPQEVGISLSEKLAQETKSFILDNQEKPFLAYLSFYAVHAPIQTSEEKWNYYRDKGLIQGLNSTGFEMERRLPIRKHQDNPVYAGLVEQMDKGVGIVLDVLDSLGLDQNTIVIFTSDNGGVASGDAYATSNRPLRGGKGYQWEGGIRVPLMMRVPTVSPRSKKIESAVSAVDLYPTLLDLCGFRLLPGQHQDGVSLQPLLAGDTLSSRSLIWHYPHYGNQGGDPSSIIRKGDWKLIHYWEDQHKELYNLQNDLSEQHDVHSEFPKITQELHTELMAYLNTVGASSPQSDPLFHPDSAAQKRLYYQTDLKDQLERTRQAMYDPDWQPNPDWWGSQITKD